VRAVLTDVNFSTGVAVAAVLLLGASGASANPPVIDAPPPAPTVAPVHISPPQQFVWPAYVYPRAEPSSEWRRATASGRGQWFIANPASGPGKQVNSDYSVAINAARAAGIRVVGYVYTDYGHRSLADVRTDIDRWQSFYGVTSIFLDETARPADERLGAYYPPLSTAIHGRGGQVVLNPGTVPDPAYFDIADSIVTFEGSAAAYRAAAVPRWTVDRPDRMIVHIVYDARSAEAAELIGLTRQRGAGHVYVTDDVLPNPYDSLPSYFEAERSRLNA
jgi:Spherulation-specific family 4